MNITLEDFNFELPANLIAIKPSYPRDRCRLMLVNNNDTSNHLFDELPQLLPKNSLIVFNNTKVLKASLQAINNQGTKFQLLYLDSSADGYFWAKVKPQKKIKIGQTIQILSSDIYLEVVNIDKQQAKVQFFCAQKSIAKLLAAYGSMPLPPYILKQRKAITDLKVNDDINYQTIFSTQGQSLAAPTAGLHFSQDLMDSLVKAGHQIAFITLDIGLGTFAKLSHADIERKKLHCEHYHISHDAASKINNALHNNQPIVAIGTTTLRALESAIKDKNIVAGNFSTSLFIMPNFTFQVVDVLVTNFHLPKSSLLILVHSFGGSKYINKAYQQAIKDGYKFYSYGDAMLIFR